MTASWINTDVNGSYENGVYKPPLYQSDEEQYKHKYYLRPLPTDGTYILEIFTKNDAVYLLKNKLKKVNESLEADIAAKKPLKEKHDSYLTEGSELLTKLDELVSAYNNSMPFFYPALPEMPKLIESYNQYYAARESYVEEDIQRTKTIFENNQTTFEENINTFITRYKELKSGSADLYEYYTTIMKNKTDVLFDVKDLVKNDDKFFDIDKKIVEYRQQIKELENQIKEEELLNGTDGEFIAYSSICTQSNFADKNNLYREVSHLGDGFYSINVINSKTMANELTVYADNKEVNEKFKNEPDRFKIAFEKDTGLYVINCSTKKDGNLLIYKAKSGGGLTWDFEGSTDFNPYECLATGNMSTSFNFNPVSKTYKVTSKNGNNGYTRVSYFDSVKPFPIEIKEEESDPILKPEYDALPLKEKAKYHKKGEATQDVDFQEYMAKVQELMPIIQSMLPATQILGPLAPILETVETVEQTAEKVDKTIGEIEKEIDEIADMEVVGVVAKPLKKIIDTLLGFIAIAIMFYIKNYEMIEKIKQIKEELKPENIKKKFKEFKDMAAEKKKEWEKKAQEKAEAAEAGKMEDDDKKKMQPEYTPNEKIVGTDGLFDDFNKDSLINLIPQEVLDEINKIEETVTTIETTVDKVATLKEYGDKIEKSWQKVQDTMSLLSGMPPYSYIERKIYEEAINNESFKQTIQQLEDFKEQQRRLKELANKQEYVKTKKVPISTIPVAQVDDVKGAISKAVPKSKGS